MEIQDGRYFCKIVYVIADPQMYRSFESIKNWQRYNFLKIFEIPGGMSPPPTNSNGGIILPPFQIEVGGSKEQPPPLG